MKLDQVNSTALQNLLKSTQRNTGKNAQAATQANDNDEVSLSHSAKLGNRVLQFSLSQSLSINGKKYNIDQQDSTDSNSDSSLFDFKKVAENVLSFVTNTIRASKQGGSDDEALKKMLGQAYKGIDKGFSDARKELDQNGLLSDPLKEGIDKSYNLIQKGMSDFEKELFGKTTDNTASANTETTAKTPVTTEQSATDKVKTPKEIGNSILAAFTGQQSATLELTTKEGDKISIQFDDQQQWRQQQSSGLAKKALQTYGELAGKSSKNSDSTSTSSSVFYSHTTQFSFKVEGDLNSSELKSISDMVNKVGSLSDSFFGGNISDALQQAKQLDLGDGQLASLSLNLYQQQAIGWQGNTDSVASTGPTDKPAENNATDSQTTDSKTAATDNTRAASDLPAVFGKLGDYLKQLQALFDQMSASFNPDAQNNLQGWVAKQQHPEQSNDQIGQFVSFNQHMQQVMAALQNGDIPSATERTAT